MPSGKPIDWSQYDDLIRRHLPQMTIEAFAATYLPSISTKAIGARARKLGVGPARYAPTEEHKRAIAAKVSTITPEIVQQVRDLRQTHSLTSIAKAIRRGTATVHRIIQEYGIELTEEGRQRAIGASAAAHVGKVTWNKGQTTPQDVRDYIGQQVSGERNGQYGRGMTEEEKTRWRSTFAERGRKRLQEWIRSPAGMEATARSISTTKSAEFRAACSKRAAEMLAAGKLKIHGPFKHGWHKSPKIDDGRGYYRSSYELRYYQMLDADDSVVAYEVEPFSIEYEFLGATLNYTPDVLVYFEDGTLRLAEIKPKCQLTWDKNAAKIRAAGDYCDGHQIEFATITEEDLS